MRELSEGRKMWLSVMAVFLGYSVILIAFASCSREWGAPFDQIDGRHLLAFSLAVLAALAFLLHRYARRMDARIYREQTRHRKIMRRELTQNISHELRTPVASILGYMETILENPDIAEDTRHQFIVRSYTQAKRLTALLQDLSTLNRMDDATSMPDMEETDVAQLVRDIVNETALALESRQMTFDDRLPGRLVITGNPSLLYGIFRNLTDNAINYAGNGSCVTLSAVELTNRWMFSFSDNGTGVPEKHLPRLFERFYRIDKGRSRQMGGTGLGLAIVKNAIQLHGGTVSVRKNVDGGLCFDFSLKKRPRHRKPPVRSLPFTRNP